jgi:hypothetical protein
MNQDLANWIRSDKKLHKIINEAESKGNSAMEQAEIAFPKLCQAYNLPQYPEDLEKFYDYYEKINVDDPRSVYEEFALIKYLNDGDDPRSMLLAAVFSVINNLSIDLKDILIKVNGEFPKESFIGIKGLRLNTEIFFADSNGELLDLGCIVMYKVINTAGNTR